MSSLIKRLSVQWDLWIGQFRAYFPTDSIDKEECLRLMNGAENLVQKEDGSVLPTLLAACQNTRNGDLIACLHIVDAQEIGKIPNRREQYNFNFFEEEQLNAMVVFTNLTIHPEYQKTQAITVLLSHCFIEILKGGGQAILMQCDSTDFSRYRRLGMRPIGPLRKTVTGLPHIPMIFLPDQEYLSIINSPVLPLLRGIFFDQYQLLCQRYYQLVRENSELQVGSAIFADDGEEADVHHSITEGLSESGKEAFLRNAMTINCREGEELITENDSGKAFGFVLRGMVKVVIGNKTIVLLAEGDLFGEIAYIMDSKRTAKVIAASPETEVVLFSESAINRLVEEADRTTIWKNLARVLAQKIMLTNKMLE